MIVQDAIPLAAAEFLGVERVGQLAMQAEGGGDWWVASLRWSAAALADRVSAGHLSSLSKFKSCAVALQNFKPSTEQQQLAKERLEIPTYVFILQAWDPADSPVYGPRLAALKGCRAAEENIELETDIFMMTEWYPACI